MSFFSTVAQVAPVVTLLIFAEGGLLRRALRGRAALRWSSVVSLGFAVITLTLVELICLRALANDQASQFDIHAVEAALLIQAGTALVLIVIRPWLEDD
jgi:hypothetical protein